MPKFNVEEYGQMVNTLAKDGEEIIKSLTQSKVEAWHHASCIPSEAGELFDAVKKWVIYNKDLDLQNVIEEMGDIEFYLAGLRQVLGISRHQTLQANVDKLNKRYSLGNYSDQQAQERADKHE